MKKQPLYTLFKFPICLFSPYFKEGAGVVKWAKGGFILLSFSLLLIACKPNNVVEAPQNPCADYITPNADFVTAYPDYVKEEFYVNPYEPKKDTLCFAKMIGFKSPFKDKDKYKHTWYIKYNTYSGVDTKHENTTYFNFLYASISKVTVSHAMRWTPNPMCNPKDTIGYDSVSFSFRVTNRFNDLKTFGKFRLVYDTLWAPAK